MLERFLLKYRKWRDEKQLGGIRSNKWPKVRVDFLRRNPICAVCGTKKDIDVHHIIPYHKAPDKELNPENLITLCTPHHFLFGHLLNWKSYNEQVEQDTHDFRLKIINRP